jgi:hypothetical protein
MTSKCSLFAVVGVPGYQKLALRAHITSVEFTSHRGHQLYIGDPGYQKVALRVHIMSVEFTSDNREHDAMMVKQW